MAEGGVDGASMKGLWDAPTMKAQGCTIREMRRYFDARTLFECGFELRTLKEDGYFSSEDLTKTGADGAALRNVGCEAKHLHQAGFSARALREAGFRATSLRSGCKCTFKELREAGYSAKECKECLWGDDPSDLAAAGFDAMSLKDAGYHIRGCKQAGLSAKFLKGAYSVHDFKYANFRITEL